jgi:predicted helicase
MARVFHANLYGDREAKYSRLLESDIINTEWLEITPQSPFHLLIPQDTQFLVEYEQYWKITDVMLVNSTGIKTHRDEFVFDFDAEALKKRIQDFRNLEIEDEAIRRQYNLQDGASWNLSAKRRLLAREKHWQSYFTSCLYRPFDTRQYFHHSSVVDRPRTEVMQNMLLGENLGLIFMRQAAIQEKYSHFIVADNVVDNRACFSNKGTMQLAPLYLYSDTKDAQQSCLKDKYPNLAQPFLRDIHNRLGYTPTSEAIFYYIYAIFHSPTYRSRYAEFLKIDFPRVPLTRNDSLFRQLAIYGEQLVALHLMKSPKLDRPITQFVDQGGNAIVDPAHPKYSNGNVIINKKGDRFVNVPEPIWNFYVGGYQVCTKWLKDRKGRTLTQEDIFHYQRIIVALQETMQLMQQIDAAIPAFPIV